MTDKVDLPKVGPINKKVLFVVGGGAAAFVAWRWYQSSRSTADAPAVDPAFGDGEVLPTVPGAYKPDNSYGIGGGSSGTDSGSTDSYGFHGTTNSQWTQYASVQLMQSDKWSYTDIVTALGKYLAGQPLSVMEVAIVQAAIAVAGYPPVGTHPIIPATSSGSVNLPSPTGLKASSVRTTSVTLSWHSVAGAAKYTVRNGSSVVSSPASTSAVIGSLNPNTSYSFSVTAVGLDGKESAPASVSVKTLTSVTPSKPGHPGKPGPSHPNKFPKLRLLYRAKRGDSFSKIAAKYKTGLSGAELYSYQFTAEAGRTAAAKAAFHERGPNLIYAGTTVAVPFAK